MISMRIVQNINEFEINSFKFNISIIGPDIFADVDPVIANTRKMAISSQRKVTCHFVASFLKSLSVIFNIAYEMINVRNIRRMVFVSEKLERIPLANK